MFNGLLIVDSATTRRSQSSKTLSLAVHDVDVAEIDPDMAPWDVPADLMELDLVYDFVSAAYYA